MRELKIRAQWTKPWIATTTGSDFSVEFRNILDMQFNPDHPNAVWCTDITYIWTHEGFAYLTSVMDLYSRKIIAWKLSNNMETGHVVDVIKQAKSRRQTDQPLILHSDRGTQFVLRLIGRQLRSSS
jgi:Transposase and inactivated derivatives